MKNVRKTSGFDKKHRIGKLAPVMPLKRSKTSKTGKRTSHACKPQKQKSTKTLKNKLWTLYSEYIRLRDCQKTTGSLEYGKCVTCGKVCHIKEMQASHFIQGRHNSVLFDDRNVHASCVKCNIWLHGNLIPYYEYMVSTYGPEVIEELKLKDAEIKNFKAWELEEMIESVKEKIKYIKSL